jgi:hypothetical protein
MIASAPSQTPAGTPELELLELLELLLEEELPEAPAPLEPSSKVVTVVSQP